MQWPQTLFPVIMQKIVLFNKVFYTCLLLLEPFLALQYCRGYWSQFDDRGAVFCIAWGFKWGLSMLQACHTSWVKSKVTGLLKDWRSDANCHCTLQKPLHAKLQFTGCLSSLQGKSYNQSGTLIVDTIYTFWEEVVCSYFNAFITLAGTLPPVQI